MPICVHVLQETIGTTRVRFDHGTESVLRVGCDELTGAVMLASPTHLSHHLTIDAPAEYPPQVKYSAVGALLRKAVLQNSSLAISRTSRSEHCLMEICRSLFARCLSRTPRQRAHVDPGFHLAPG